jgi:hypothetical protein
MTEGGEVAPRIGNLLTLDRDEIRSVLEMKDGPYASFDSLDLLREGLMWVEERIFSAVERTGFSPDEYRNVVEFSARTEDPATGMTLMSSN